MTLRIRPVTRHDHGAILGLAKIAGIGMSSLPPDEAVLHHKIEHATQSFAGKPIKPQEETFLFVLEDMETGALVGTTGIYAHVGLSRPFYSYKISVISQASSAIGIYSLQQVLHMVNDYTGASEIGSLFLQEAYRRDGIGRLLSRCRYLMMAEFPHLFADMIIAEVRGVQAENGDSPFYDNLARHFFKVSFKEADYIYATQGSQFIADLMPKYPIYVNLLSQAAQAVIGVPLPASRPAMQLLMKEGFSSEGYVDLFDAGPTLQAKREHIHTVKTSVKAEIVDIRPLNTPASYLISNTRLQNFSIVMGSLEKVENGVIITPETANALSLNKKDKVRYVL